MISIQHDFLMVHDGPWWVQESSASSASGLSTWKLQGDLDDENRCSWYEENAMCVASSKHISDGSSPWEFRDPKGAPTCERGHDPKP